MRTSAGRLLWGTLLAFGCGDDGAAKGDMRDANPATGQDASAMVPSGDAGSGSCDLTGVWIGRMNTESLALGQPQYANNWYYFELTQDGSALTVARHMDCGLEVRGDVTVLLAPATTDALRAHNVQTGRKGTVTAQGDGTCALDTEHFWSVRGVSESAFVPTPRTSSDSLAQVQAALPLPPANRPERTEDWDGDGKPGIAWAVTGIVQGERHTAQRDWTRYFTAPGYEIRAVADFPSDLVVRAEFSNEEVVYESSAGLGQVSQPNASAAHTLTLRFLGRTKDDARARAIVVAGDDRATCVNVRTTLPAKRALR